MPAPLTRRQFMIGAAGAGIAGATAVAVAHQPWTQFLGGSPTHTDALAHGKGVLVLVTLYGGNDGLNTVIPFSDGHYLGGRPTLGYHPNEVLALADGLALHPNLKGLKSLWDAKQLAIVRGVGYPNPVRSHFRSMDIWQTGSPETAITTGCLGRWLDATGTDPMRALSVGSTLPRILLGEKQTGTAIAATGVKVAYGARMGQVLSALDAPGPDRTGLAARVATSGSDLLKVEHTLADLLRGPAPNRGGPGRGGAQSSELAAQLDLVARLIQAGSPTRVYQVSASGFDNHAQEKQTHARLMTDLDAAVTGFFAALKASRAGDGVVLMTYSEFGRRVTQNASGGTDHGTAAPLFVAGRPVKGRKFYGEEPSLTDLDQGDLKFTTDFRSVFATVLGHVIGVDPKVSLNGSFSALDFV